MTRAQYDAVLEFLPQVEIVRIIYECYVIPAEEWEYGEQRKTQYFMKMRVLHYMPQVTMFYQQTKYTNRLSGKYQFHVDLKEMCELTCCFQSYVWFLVWHGHPRAAQVRKVFLYEPFQRLWTVLEDVTLFTEAYDWVHYNNHGWRPHLF